MLIFHLEICVNVFQLIQHVNISFEICSNVLGIRNMCKSSMGPPWIPIRIINKLIFHWKYV